MPGDIIMEKIRKQLEMLKGDFRELADRKNGFMIRFAEFLLSGDQDDRIAEYSELKEGVERINGIKSAIEGYENNISEINKIIDNLDDLEEQRKNTRSSIRDLDKANQSLYENMGRAGYQAFKEGFLTGEGYAAVFSSLEEEKEKINTFEVELKKGSSGETGFFKKLVKSSKNVYLKSNQNLRLRNLVKIYQKAGEALGEMDFPVNDYEPLKNAFSPYFKNRRNRRNLRKKIKHFWMKSLK